MFKKIIFFNEGIISSSNLGLKLLYIGVFLLPTAPAIAGFILFLSLLSKLIFDKLLDWFLLVLDFSSKDLLLFINILYFNSPSFFF